MRKTILCAAIISATLVNTIAFAEKMTCHGQVGTGTLDSNVGDCIFISHSADGTKISRVCKMLDQCEVVADVKPMKGFDTFEINKVYSVKLIKKLGPGLIGAGALAPASAETMTCKGDVFPTILDGEACSLGLTKLSAADINKIWAVCESSEPCEITAIVKIVPETKTSARLVNAVKILKVKKLIK